MNSALRLGREFDSFERERGILQGYSKCVYYGHVRETLVYLTREDVVSIASASIRLRSKCSVLIGKPQLQFTIRFKHIKAVKHPHNIDN